MKGPPPPCWPCTWDSVSTLLAQGVVQSRESREICGVLSPSLESRLRHRLQPNRFALWGSESAVLIPGLGGFRNKVTFFKATAMICLLGGQHTNEACAEGLILQFNSLLTFFSTRGRGLELARGPLTRSSQQWTASGTIRSEAFQSFGTVTTVAIEGIRSSGLASG